MLRKTDPALHPRFQNCGTALLLVTPWFKSVRCNPQRVRCSAFNECTIRQRVRVQTKRPA